MATEPLPLVVQRTLIDFVDIVVADLTVDGEAPIDSGVHDARKKLKRLRAVLRLVRDPLGEDIYRHENAVLRDAGRCLSPVRDAGVRLETLGSLADRSPERLAGSWYEATECWLRDLHASALEEYSARSRPRAMDMLRSHRSRLAVYPFHAMIPDGFGAVSVGLERVYRRGHRGHRRATRSPDAPGLHEWRKRVKYLRYQLEFLASYHEPAGVVLSRDLDRLGEILGRDHDLDVLGHTVTNRSGPGSDERSRSLLMAVISDERSAIRDESLQLGAAVYAEEPEVFVRRIKGNWAPGSEGG